MGHRGRPPVHLSQRVASGVWYCNVVRVCQKGQEKRVTACWLDRTLLKPAASEDVIDSADRQRVFWRIETGRRSPNHSRYRNSHDGDRAYNLLELVDAAKPGTAILFTSDVWRLLGPSPPDLFETQRVIAMLLTGRRLRRVNSLVALLQASHVASTHPLHPRVANNRVLTKILQQAGENEPSIDNLTLVCALAREAALFGDREVLHERLADVDLAASMFAAALPLKLVKDLRKDFLKVIRDFSMSLLHMALPASYAEVLPYSVIVPDTQQLRTLEEEALREIRHGIGPWAEKRMAQLDAARPGWDDGEE
jgi:hypothetical protein